MAVNIQQEFCFVNGMDVDRSTKKRMRRHVMIGKNVGKKIQRKSKRDILQARMNDASGIISCRQRQRDRFALCASSLEPRSVYNDVLCGLTFPVAITPYFADVISTFFLFVAHRIYPVALGLSMDNSKFTWMRILMSDKAAFYCNIALMQATNELFLGEGENSQSAMYYLSTTLKYVRERLESKDALSDSTMGIVTSLITQEQCRQQHKAARVHLDGLVQMINLRGGLKSLESTMPVLLKACKTDVMYTLQREDKPRFHRYNMPQIISTLHSLNLSFDREAAKSQVRHSGMNPVVVDVLLDIICTSVLFSNPFCAGKVDLYLFQDLLVSICYSLLAIPHTHSSPTIEDAYHVGLTLFMMTLFLQVGSKRVMNYDNVTRRLQRILESNILENEDGLKLWLMMMGGVWVADDVGTEWLTSMMFTQWRKMQLHNWIEARDVVEGWPWIRTLHDGPGKLLWEKARYET